jgi:hypothetical protein
MARRKSPANVVPGSRDQGAGALMSPPGSGRYPLRSTARVFRGPMFAARSRVAPTRSHRDGDRGRNRHTARRRDGGDDKVIRLRSPLSPADKQLWSDVRGDLPKAPLTSRIMNQKRRTTAASPPTTPTAITPTLTAASSRRLNERATIASEGTLTGGSAINNTPAGPTPTPSDNIA